MAKKTLFSFELEAGMIVAEDVYKSNGQLIFPKHTMLNDLMIAKLPLYNIMEIPIEDGPIEKPTIDIEKLTALAKATAQKEPLSYSDRIKQSPEFKDFNVKYTASLNVTENALKAFVQDGAPIDVDGLVSNTTSLLSATNNTLQIFDMLHNMQVSNDAVFVHSVNVSLIAATLGKWLNFSNQDIDLLTLSGLLHDVGKNSIPKEILEKPGKLTPEEYELIKTHPKKGYAYIKDLPIDIRVKEVCLLHHERCDGSGYPFGLVGSKISPFAKIIAIADVYDAMISARSYREALCPFEAIRLFEKDGLHKYDPQFILTFLENVGASYIHNNVLLSDGSTGEIVMLNKMNLSKPMIKCKEEFVDLSKRPDLYIKSII